MSKWVNLFESSKRTVFQQCLHNRRLIELIIRNTPERGRILEAGCGTGLLSLILADCGFMVTGLDLDEEIIQYARSRVCLNNTQLTLVQGDMLKLSSRFDEGSFDTVCHSGVMEHFSDEDIVAILSQQRRIADKVIFNIPNNRAKLSKNSFGDERLLNNKKWVRLIRKSGFKKVMVFGGYDLSVLSYLILPGVLFTQPASFWWKWFSRHSIFVCQ